VNRSSKLILAVVSLVMLSGAVPDSKPKPLPPYTSAYEPQTVDERGQWMQADEYEARLRSSALNIRDEIIVNYVRQVLCETVGQDRCRSVRLYVLEVPAFNASMAPNGVMTVWTGLLLRARSEAELAAVLAHEFAHFELRHGVEGFKQRRAATDALAWVQVLGAISNANVSDTQWSLVGSIYRFNRQQEMAADLLGLDYLRNSRYPAATAANLWQHLMAEADATAAGRLYKKKHRYEAGFFDTHPTDLARTIYLRAEAAKAADPGDENVGGHQAAVAPLRQRLLAAQVKLNDFGGSDYLLSELAKIHGWTGELLFARAELYRERGNPRDLVTASQLYDQAIKAGHNTPESYRGLGLTLLKGGEVSSGRAALSEYLKLKPNAGDAKIIETLVK
jgi:predicted Zn-dependent protease